MKFLRIFTMELGYQLRQVTVWLYFWVTLTLAFLWVIGNYVHDARDGYILVNAPIVIAAVAVLCCVSWLLIGASVAGDAAARDVQTRMYSLTYTAPTSKVAYLGGRFLAALVVNGLILLSIPLGLLVANHFTGIEPEIMVPFRATAYLTCFFFIVLPNAFIATGIQFSIAVLTRNPMGSYLGGALLFVAAFLLGQVLQNKGEWGNLIDPMGFTPVQGHLTNWSLLQRESRLILLEGSFLINRLLWIGITLVLLLVAYSRFSFRLPERGQKRKNLLPVQEPKGAVEKLRWSSGKVMPQTRGTFGFATQLHQLRLLTWAVFLQLAKSKAGLPLLAALAMMSAFALNGNLKGRGVPLLPRTDFVLHVFMAPLTQPEPFWIIIALLTSYYAGELVWRDRETGLSQLSDVAPVPEWVHVGSKILALSLVLVGWLTFLIIAGSIGQLALGHILPDIGLYLQVAFGLQLVDCLLFALLVLLVHVLVNQKYVGHLVALSQYGCIALASTLGLEHKLLIYSASPNWTYRCL